MAVGLSPLVGFPSDQMQYSGVEISGGMIVCPETEEAMLLAHSDQTRSRRCRFVGLLCLFLVVASASAALAGEHDTDEVKKDALERRIKKLRSRYEQLVLEGEEDERLKLAMREAIEAAHAGDWEKVEEVLEAYERPVVETGEEEGEETGVETEEYGIVEKKVSYRSGDLLLSALVFVPNMPDKDPPFPAVLLIHNNFLGTGLAERKIAKAIAEKYYTVMIAEPRGYGKNPGKAEFALSEVEDVIAAVKALQALEEYDPKTKPALIGDRHGANCVLLAAAQLADDIAVVLAINPYPDIAAALKKPELRTLLRKLRLRISRFDTRSTLPRSPYHNVSGVACPVRLFYGKKNVTVRSDDMQRYVSLLEARKVKVKQEDFLTAGSDLFDQANLIKAELIKTLEEIFRPKRKPRSRRGGRQRR